MLACLCTQTAVAGEPVVRFDALLPSGLRLQLAPDPTVPVVGLSMVIDAGSVHEPVDKAGLAHLVEHLAFHAEQPERPPHGAFLDALGCDANAFTSFETVQYNTACPSAVFSHAFQSELRRLVAPLAGVGQGQLDAERAVVHAERREREGRTGVLRTVLEAFHDAADPYGHLPIGSPDTLDAITLDDLQRFVDARYRPEHTTLVLTGDFDPGTALNVFSRTLPPDLLSPGLTEADYAVQSLTLDHPLDTMLAWWPVLSGAPPPPDVLGARQPVGPGTLSAMAADPSVRSLVIEVDPEDLDAEDDEQYGMVAWSLPPFPEHDEVAQVQLAVVAESTLERRIPKATWVACDTLSTRVELLLYCSLAVPANQPADWIDKARSLGRVDGTRSADVLPGLRRYHHDASVLDLELIAGASSGRAPAFAEHAHRGGTTDLVVALEARLARLSPTLHDDRLQRGALPERSRAWRVRYEAKAQDARLSDEGTDASTAGEAHPHATAGQAGLASLPERLNDAKNPALAAVPTVRRLANGATLVVQQHGDYLLSQVTVYLPWGRLDGPSLEAGMAWDASLTVPGRRRRPSRASDRAGLLPWWQIDQFPDMARVGVTVSKGELPRAMEVLRKWVDGVEVEDKALETLVARWKEDRHELSADPDVALTRAFRDAIGLPPTTFLHLDDEAFDALLTQTSEALHARIKEAYRPDGAVIVVVGPSSVEQVLPEAERLFRTWPERGARPDRVPLAVQQPVSTALVRDEPGALRTEVSLVCSLPTRLDDDQVDALASLLRRRQSRVLREELGIAYVAGADVWTSSGRTLLSLDTRVAHEDVLTAFTAQRNVLADVASGGVSPEEAAWASRRAGLARVLALQTTRQVTSTLARRALYHHDLEAWLAQVRAGTPPDLGDALDAVQGCTDHQVVVLSGPADTLARLVREPLALPWQVFRDPPPDTPTTEAP